jgi:hypothetical protein
MERRDRGSAIDTRAFECALAAVAALLAADGIRTTLGPLWRVLRSLLGL